MAELFQVFMALPPRLHPQSHYEVKSGEVERLWRGVFRQAYSALPAATRKRLEVGAPHTWVMGSKTVSKSRFALGRDPEWQRWLGHSWSFRTV